MAAKLTAEQKKAYMKNGASQCPFCQSPNISGATVQIDGPCAWQPVTCDDCGMEWHDLYKHVDIDDTFCND